MTTLIVCNGKHSGREFVLPDREVVVGRDESCDIRLSSGRVSRRHCTLKPAPHGLTLCDLGSSNGTVVNGQAVVGTQVLEPGDRIRVGPWEFEVAGPKPIPPGTKLESDIADWLGDADESTTDGSDTTMIPVSRPTPPPREFKSVAEEAADIIRRHQQGLE